MRLRAGQRPDAVCDFRYHVRAGTPGFILLVEGSKKQREFLKNYTVVP